MEKLTEKMFLCGSLGQLKVACCIPHYPSYGLSTQVECYGEVSPDIGSMCDQGKGIGWLLLLLDAVARPLSSDLDSPRALEW